MDGHGTFADEQPLGNLAVGTSPGNQPGHFALPLGETAECRPARSARGQWPQAGQTRYGCVEERLPQRVIRRERPGGPAAARNEGWRAAGAPLVAFTDDDCVATPVWLEEALRAAREEPGAIVQGRTEPDPDEPGESIH